MNLSRESLLHITLQMWVVVGESWQTAGKASGFA